MLINSTKMSFKPQLEYISTKKVANPCEEIPPYLLFLPIIISDTLHFTSYLPICFSR